MYILLLLDSITIIYYDRNRSVNRYVHKITFVVFKTKCYKKGVDRCKGRK